MSSSSSSSSSSSTYLSSSSEDTSSSNTHDRNNHVLSTYARVASLLHDDTATSSKQSNTRNYIEKDREAAHNRLVQDYFAENPVFGDEIFTRRFRMRKKLFVKIVADIETQFPFFKSSSDARGKNSFTSLQKCTSAIRQLAYGTIPDEHDNYLMMSKRTSRESLEKFCASIIQLYGKEYLRKPTVHDIQRLNADHESRHGFPGMLGSIDCTHWPWRKFPTTLRGGHEHPTIMLEAVASHDLWFWHAFFEVGTSNHVIDDVLNGTAPQCPFHVNSVEYKHGYYLVDEKYPDWGITVKTFVYPNNDKQRRFNVAQESARKDVERAFGVLKNRWGVVRLTAQIMHPQKIKSIIYACIILHNMILTDEGLAVYPFHENELSIGQEGVEANQDILMELCCQEKHENLRSDLVEHLRTEP